MGQIVRYGDKIRLKSRYYDMYIRQNPNGATKPFTLTKKPDEYCEFVLTDYEWTSNAPIAMGVNNIGAQDRFWTFRLKCPLFNADKQITTRQPDHGFLAAGVSGGKADDYETFLFLDWRQKDYGLSSMPVWDTDPVIIKNLAGDSDPSVLINPAKNQVAANTTPSKATTFQIEIVGKENHIGRFVDNAPYFTFKRIVDITSSALALIPYVGGALAGLTKAIIPGDNSALGMQILKQVQAYVNQVVDTEISALKAEELELALSGLLKVLARYNTCNASERKGYFQGLLDDLSQHEPKFNRYLKEAPESTLGYFVSFVTIYLSALKTQQTHYGFIFSPNNPAATDPQAAKRLKELQGKIKKYRKIVAEQKQKIINHAVSKAANNPSFDAVGQVRSDISAKVEVILAPSDLWAAMDPAKKFKRVEKTIEVKSGLYGAAKDAPSLTSTSGVVAFSMKMGDGVVKNFKCFSQADPISNVVSADDRSGVLNGNTYKLSAGETISAVYGFQRNGINGLYFKTQTKKWADRPQPDYGVGTNVRIPLSRITFYDVFWQATPPPGVDARLKTIDAGTDANDNLKTLRFTWEYKLYKLEEVQA